MGKILIELAIPAIIGAFMAWSLVKYWYLRVFPRGIRNYKEISKASEKYEKEMEKIKL